MLPVIRQQGEGSLGSDYKVQHLIDQYLNREIDYLMLTSQFRKLGWSTAGLFEVVQHQERQRQETARADGRQVEEVRRNVG